MSNETDRTDIQNALETDRVIDITTTGRNSGQPRRIEIWFHRVDGRFYITGTPGRRSWYANLIAHPDFTFHLKHSAQADLPATATPVTDPAERARITEAIVADLGGKVTLDATSPLVGVTFPAAAA
ncbi:MAG TPA: nitroreductase/quinone reductase family protein [Pseudolysinimonas sp.]|nr:nitroreductase/quinone reductase family protein [Pseudolysinimonas sp.]